MSTKEFLIFQALYGNGPPGFVTLLKFCKAVDAGETPPADVLQDCNRAFKRLLEAEDREVGLMFFADELQLNKKTTRIRTIDAADAELAMVIEVLKLVRDGMKESKAKKEIAEKRNKSLRRIQDYYKKHQKDANWYLDNFKI